MTKPQFPQLPTKGWAEANAACERVIGTLRRELLDRDHRTARRQPVHSTATRAVAADDGTWRVSGTKTWISR